MILWQHTLSQVESTRTVLQHDGVVPHGARSTHQNESSLNLNAARCAMTAHDAPMLKRGDWSKVVALTLACGCQQAPEAGEQTAAARLPITAGGAILGFEDVSG